MPIRSWSLSDLPQIIELLSELSHSIGFPYHKNQDLLKKHYLLTEKHPDFYSTFVYVDNDAIVGMVSMVFYSSALHQTGTALINELIVAPGLRRKGIGKQLLLHCVDLAKTRGFDEIEVGVQRANISAVGFYKKNGFDKEYILLGKEFLELTE